MNVETQVPKESEESEALQFMTTLKTDKKLSQEIDNLSDDNKKVLFESAFATLKGYNKVKFDKLRKAEIVKRKTTKRRAKNKVARKTRRNQHRKNA